MTGEITEADRLSAALAGLPQTLRAAAELPMPDLRDVALRSRRFICAGLGSSSAHARFLAAQLSASGMAAQALPLGSEGLRRGDALLIFSQGLSAPVQRTISSLAPDVAVVLVTTVDPTNPDSGSLARREWLAAAEQAGLRRVPMMGAMEYGSLVRVTGPVTGYLTALRLANALGASFDLPVEKIVGEVVDCLGPRRSIPGPEVFQNEFSLLAMGLHAECLENLALKVQEGLLVPAPPVLSVEQLAHGPFQEAYPRSRHWVVFTHPDRAEEAEALRRLREMLPENHMLCEVRAGLDSPWAIFSHEVLWTRALLAEREKKAFPTGAWPGHGKDGPLYNWGAEAGPPQPRQHLPVPLEDWTSPELGEILARKPTTLVVPLGSTEQHGPHLPLGTDTWIAAAIAERFCSHLPDAVCLPPVPFGIASEHQGFAGTLSVAEKNFIPLLCDLLRSAAHHGPAAILVFSAHGGNESFLMKNEALLADAAAPAQFLLASIPSLVSDALVSLAASSGVSAAEAGWHAGELETSMILGLRPASVRRERFRQGHVDLDIPADQLFYPDLSERVPSGVVGDPRPATQLRAEGYLARWVEELLEFYRSRARVHQTNGTKKA